MQELNLFFVWIKIIWRGYKNLKDYVTWLNVVHNKIMVPFQLSHRFLIQKPEFVNIPERLLEGMSHDLQKKEIRYFY